MKMAFAKLPRSLLNTHHNQRLFGDVAEAIAQTAELSRHVINVSRLHSLPQQAQVIYWLWKFACEAGINGMDKFVLDSLGIHSPEIHAALGQVGASQIARLLEVAVSLARSGPAEFKRLTIQTWFNQFPQSADVTELSALNRPVFGMMDELTDLVASYIRANEQILFAP